MAVDKGVLALAAILGAVGLAILWNRHGLIKDLCAAIDIIEKVASDNNLKPKRYLSDGTLSDVTFDDIRKELGLT